MPALLLRAIVTGFGYKIGAELGRFVSEKVGLAKKPDEKKAAEEDSGYPTGMTDGPDPDADPDPDARPDQDPGQGESGDGSADAGAKETAA